MRQLLHFPGRHALHKGFLYYLYEHCFAAVAAPAVRALTFLCAQLLIHLGLHEVCPQPLLSDLWYSFCEPLGSLLYIMIFSTTIILQEP